MTIKKQSIGIDISHQSFTATICFVKSDGSFSFSKTHTFPNNKQGFNQLMRWVRKHCDGSIPTVFLMEATGVYHENLAYHLYKLKQTVHVVLANTSKHYASSLNQKTKTDAVDSRMLARFGGERQHKVWQPPAPTMRSLRALTRYRVQLIEQQSALKAILHSKEEAHEVSSVITSSNQKIIKFLDGKIEEIDKQIRKLVADNKELKAKIDQQVTIPGIGLITAVTIIAETQGFHEFKNQRQLISYAGYDVVANESGSSVRGKTKISKKGNRYIRRAMNQPAMSAIQHNPDLKQFYTRLVNRNPIRMKALVAVQRKLLVLMYTLWKTDNAYLEGYQKNVAPSKKSEATLDSPEGLPSKV